MKDGPMTEHINRSTEGMIKAEYVTILTAKCPKPGSLAAGTNTLSGIGIILPPQVDHLKNYHGSHHFYETA